MYFSSDYLDIDLNILFFLEWMHMRFENKKLLQLNFSQKNFIELCSHMLKLLIMIFWYSGKMFSICTTQNHNVYLIYVDKNYFLPSNFCIIDSKYNFYR